MSNEFTFEAKISVQNVDNILIDDHNIKVKEVTPFEQLIHAQRYVYGSPDSFIINLKYKNVNFKIYNTDFKFTNLTPTNGYLVVEWFPMIPLLKIHDQDKCIDRIKQNKL